MKYLLIISFFLLGCEEQNSMRYIMQAAKAGSNKNESACFTVSGDEILNGRYCLSYKGDR